MTNRTKIIDENVLENMICKDSLLMRACILQAKWNGTTVEEEYRKTVSYKRHAPRKKENSETNEDDAYRMFPIRKAIDGAPMLLRNEREACIYHNKYVKGIKDCCEGHRCDHDCPNRVRL